MSVATGHKRGSMKTYEYGIWIRCRKKHHTRDEFVKLLHQNRGEELMFTVWINGNRKRFKPNTTPKDVESDEVVGEFLSFIGEWENKGAKVKLYDNLGAFVISW